MASDINSITIIGRLTADPTTKVIGTGTNLAEFSIASNFYAGKGKEPGVSFIGVTAWGKLAEIVCKYMHKGMRVCVSGELRQQRWQGKDGKNASKHIINANAVQMLDPKKDGAPSASAPAEGEYVPFDESDGAL